MQDRGDEDALLDDCRSGWMAVEMDTSASLAKPEQLRYALQCMGRNPSGKAIERYWYQCGGKMSFQQFSVVMKKEPRVTMGDLMNSFRRIDSIGDGTVSSQELMALLTKHGEKMSREELQSILDDIDPEGTGKLDYAELSHMLMNVAEECAKAYRTRGARLLELTARGRSQSEGRSLNTSRKASEGRKGTPRSEGRKGTSHSERRKGTPHSEGRKGTPHSEGRKGTPHNEGRKGTPHSDHTTQRSVGHRTQSEEYYISGHHYQQGAQATTSASSAPVLGARMSKHSVRQGDTRHMVKGLDAHPGHHDRPHPHGSSRHLSPSRPHPHPSHLPVASVYVASDDSAMPLITPPQPNTQQKLKAAEHVSLPSNKTPLPAEPVSLPSNKTPLPGEPVSLPSNKAPLPAEPVSLPSNKASLLAEPVSLPSNKAPLPAEPVSLPSNKAPLPAEPVSLPFNKAPLPGEPVSLPSNKAPLPAEPVSLPSNKTPLPAEPVSLPSNKASLLAEPVSLPSNKAPLPAEPVSLPSNKAPLPGEPVSLPSNEATLPAEPVSLSLNEVPLPVVTDSSNTDEMAEPAEDVLPFDTPGKEIPGMEESHSASNQHKQTNVPSEVECPTHLPPISSKLSLPIADPSLTPTAPPAPPHPTPLVPNPTNGPPSVEVTTPPTSPPTPPKSAATPPTTTPLLASLSMRESSGVESPLPTESVSIGQSSDIPSTPEEELEESGEDGEEEDLEWKKPLYQAMGKPPVAPFPVGQQLSTPPANLDSWNTIAAKGCFYGDLHEGDDLLCVSCQQFCLNLPVASKLCFEISPISPGNHSTDISLFVFHVDGEERPTELITYTHYQYGQRCVRQVDLERGSYALVPFTSGCHQRPVEEQEYPVPLVLQEGGKVTLTQQCKEALEEIFHRIDLDDNGSISRTELDFFQERTCGEMCDDAAWKVIQENFEMTEEDELTLKGFIDLHIMTAEDPEGGEAELWVVMTALGYSHQLQLAQACPFQFTVFTESCETEIEIVEMCLVSSIINPVVVQLACAQGMCDRVKEGGEDLKTYSYSIGHLTSIVLENKGPKHASVQLDCSRSTNMAVNRESSVHVLDIVPHSAVVGFHLVPQDPEKPYSVNCVACKILS